MTLILLLYFLVLYCIFNKGSEVNSKKKFTRYASFAMILISSLRHEGVGNDTHAYMARYERFDMSWTEVFASFIPKYISPGLIGKDPGIDVFEKLCHYIIPDGRWYLALVATITIVSVSFFILNNAKTLKATFFAFVFYASMFYQYAPNSAFRQSLAIAILLFSQLALQRDRKVLFVVLVFVASTFHQSALVCLSFLIVPYIKNIDIVYKASVIGFLIVLLAPEQVAIMLGGANEVYSDYIGDDYYQRASKPYMIIVFVLCLYVISWMINKRDLIKQDNRFYYFGVAMTFVLTPMIWVDPSAIRLIAYFGLFIPLLIGNEIKLIPNSGTIFMIVLITFYLRVATYSDNYHFMWQDMKLHDRYSYVAPYGIRQKEDSLTYYCA